MRLWAGTLLAASLVLAGCGGDGGGDPNQDVTLTGNWTWQANASNGPLQVSCVATGSLFIEMTASDQFTGELSQGEGNCTSPSGDLPFDPNGPLTAGTINGQQVSYTDGICSYKGTATGDPVNKVEGPVTCDLSVEGTKVHLTGTWQITS